MVLKNYLNHVEKYTVKNIRNETDDKKNAKCEEKKSIDYDPYDYGNQTHPTIFWGPVFHLFKAIIGTGILAIPYNFQSVGYATGIIGTILIGILYIHIIQIFLDVEYELCKILRVSNLTYVGVVQHSFEKGPKSVHKFTFGVKFCVYFNYVVNGSLGNAVYLIMIANNFKIIIDYYYSIDSNLLIIISVVIIPLLMLGCIRNLKFLVPMSILTNFFNFVNIILILTISPNYDKIKDIKPINDLSQFPTFFGIVLGALSGTGMMLPLKNDMRNPARFSTLFGVMNIAVAGASILYALFGFFGYLKYGNQINSNILSNLPPDHYLTLLVLVLYSVAICVSYTLFVYVAFDTIWSNVFKNLEIKNKLGIEYALRISLNILPYLIAIAVPNFQIILSVGGVIGILMEVGLPPFLQILILMSSEERTRWNNVIIIKNLIIVAIAIALFIGGVINVINMMNEFFS